MTVQFNPRTLSRGIEWCDRTENPIGGCFHGCAWDMPDGQRAECYAGDVATGVAQSAYPEGFEHHYWRPHLLRSLANGRKPELIFANSMSDWMGHWVPEEQIREMLDVMRTTPHHTYILLTKAAPRLLKFKDAIPPNTWVMVSSPPDHMMGKPLSRNAQINMLKKTLDVLAEVGQGVPVVGMSIEPLSWDVAEYLPADHPLKWGIIGAASNGKKYYQPEPGCVQRLLDIFDATQTPVFFKGNLEWRPRREDFPYVEGSAAAVVRRQAMAKLHGWPINTYLPGSMPTTDEAGLANENSKIAAAMTPTAQRPLFSLEYVA